MVEGGGLENRYGSLAHREFESLPLRSTGAAGSAQFSGPGFGHIGPWPKVSESAARFGMMSAMAGAVIVDLAFLLSGIAMVLWAGPFERYWQRHPDMPMSPWMYMFGNQPSARRLRILGTIWILIGGLVGFYLVKLSTAPQ